MRINITAKGVAVPPNLKDLVEGKLTKLERILRGIESVDVTCSRERQWRILEVTVEGNGLLVRGEDRSADFQSALDSLFDKLERRIKKSRGRLRERYRGGGVRNVEESIGEADSESPSEPRLVRSKRFTVKPMSPEDASIEMEMLGHDFFVFRNAETEQVNVLYRRKDGNYGLIEPEF